MNRIKHVCLFIFSGLSQSPEKTLPLDLTGMARMKRHKRLDWNEALTALAKRRLGNVERQPLLFLESVFVWELSSCTVWGDVWPFWLCSHKKRAVWALCTRLVALSLNVWEVSPQNKMDHKRAQQEGGHGISRPLQMGCSKFWIFKLNIFVKNTLCNQ